MNLESGVSLGQLLIAIGVLLVGGAVTWGGLLQRVKALEHEVEVLSGLTERLTRIEEKTTYIGAEISKLTGSWLFREPPGYEGIERQVGAPKPQPRRTK